MTEKLDPSEPRVEYEERLRRHRDRAARFLARERQLGNARMVVFLAGAILLWLVAAARAVSAIWLALPGAAFLGLGLWHQATRRRRGVAECRAEFYSRGLARLNGTWAGAGSTGMEYLPEDHAYAADLDVLGEGSLFQLLCTARTTQGEATLAGWLLAPATREVIEDRQEAAKELAPLLEFREDLSVLGGAVGSRLDVESLAAWSLARESGLTAGPRLVAGVVAGLTLATAVAWLGFGAPGLLALGALTIQLAFAGAYRTRVARVVAGVGLPARQLGVLAALMARIAEQPLRCPLLATTGGVLGTAQASPSRAIVRLERLVQWLDSRRNQLFAPVFALALGSTQLAMAVESWRRRYGAEVPGWLAAVGDLEGLSSLGALAYEHPADAFPILAAGPEFVAENLGHPLLPTDDCVRNDIRLDFRNRLLVVSGSNMSGKSTLLRAVGTNAVLALAGGPVRASSLAISRLRVAASIRLQDSLRDGRSRFYTEIIRLRRMTRMAELEPVLYLIDELLHGTNSHDRRIGAEAVLRGLVERGAVGIVTTHDLALATLVENHPEWGSNVHLRDYLDDGRMVFDYRLHEGVVRHSNALELMRSVGLDVGPHPA